MEETLKKVLHFLGKAEKLKREMRHSWLSDNRQESVAEHTWRMALMAILLRGRLDVGIDLEKVLKMIIIHDLVEIEAGDVSALEVLENPEIKAIKEARERAAIENIREELGQEVGKEIYDLWIEFEDKTTAESKFSNALDKLEVQLQHNHAPMETWEEVEFEMVYTLDEHVAFDSTMSRFKNLIVAQAEEKMQENGISPDHHKPKP